MPIISGFVVPKMNSTSHVGNIRLLRPMVVNIKRKEDNQAKNDHTKDAEETKRNTTFAFIGENFIDLTERSEAVTCIITLYAKKSAISSRIGATL